MHGYNRVIGSMIIVVGLYSVLWGKYEEEKEEKRKREVEQVTEAVKAHNNNAADHDHDHDHDHVNGDDDVDTAKNEVAFNLPLSTKPLHQV